MDLAGKLREGYFRSPGIATAVSVIIPKLRWGGVEEGGGGVSGERGAIETRNAAVAISRATLAVVRRSVCTPRLRNEINKFRCDEIARLAITIRHVLLACHDFSQMIPDARVYPEFHYI